MHRDLSCKMRSARSLLMWLFQLLVGAALWQMRSRCECFDRKRKAKMIVTLLLGYFALNLFIVFLLF